MLIFTKARPIRAVQTRLLEKPSLLRDVCDEINHNNDLVKLPSIKRAQQQLVSDSSPFQIFKRPMCTCGLSTYSVGSHDRSRPRYSWHRWNAKLSASSLSHREDCKFFNYFERENSLNLKLIYYRGIIAQVVKASIHLRRGAGGFSLSPNLSCIRVVSQDSPAFELVRTYLRPLRFNPDPQLPPFDDLIRRLHELFQDGRASPHDVNPRGHTLLHVSHLFAAASSH